MNILEHRFYAITTCHVSAKFGIEISEGTECEIVCDDENYFIIIPGTNDSILIKIRENEFDMIY